MRCRKGGLAVAFHVPELLRACYSGRMGELNRQAVGSNNGIFEWETSSGRIRVVASDGGGWEHVSVSLERRTPTWEEMCKVKDIFWDPEDCVMQLHPPKSEYVNFAKNCLHLWRPVAGEVPPIPQPPRWMVGPK